MFLVPHTQSGVVVITNATPRMDTAYLSAQLLPYVFGIHAAILAITLGLWVWWQRNYPNHIQGASVPITVAGICISIFWASTGSLKGLR